MPAAPQTIALYLAHLTTAKTPAGKDYSRATIARRVASIAYMHRERSAADPTKDPVIVGLMEGIRRDLAGRPTAAKSAVLTKHLRKGLKIEPVKPAHFRNRALLHIGFAGAFRRSELVAIDVEQLHFDEENRLRVTLPKSKTNQYGEPESVWILPAGAYCPVRALRAWLEVAGITCGAVFRSIDRHKNVKGRISEELVPYIVKRFARSARLDPEQFSGHSLRSGHVTQSLLNDVPLHTIQQPTRHRDINTLWATTAM
jgi:site-specific recombinase XerD